MLVLYCNVFLTFLNKFKLKFHILKKMSGKVDFLLCQLLKSI
jgi:hypothetical protein